MNLSLTDTVLNAASYGIRLCKLLDAQASSGGLRRDQIRMIADPLYRLRDRIEHDTHSATNPSPALAKEMVETLRGLLDFALGAREFRDIRDFDYLFGETSRHLHNIVAHPDYRPPRDARGPFNKGG